MDFKKLLAQVDCHFMSEDKPYTSASSRDKPRYHVWDNWNEVALLFDNEQDLLRSIIHRHQLIAERLRQHIRY